MTRWLPRSSTGTSAGKGAALLGAALLLVASPQPARGQALKLASLHIPSTSVVGPWVAYRVRSQTRSIPVREYTQRVAVVAREPHRGGDGFWVELKTEGLSSGRRIERGFFVPPEGGAGSAASGERAYELERYQVLHSNGKLYEYPPERLQEVRAGGDVSTIELFEYDPEVPPVLESLGPDTLRVGKRVVPVDAERSLRVGSNAWPVRGDTTFVNRSLLVQTLWKNSAVPITGLARSLFQVVTERVPSSAREAAPTGSSAPPVPPYEPVITGAATTAPPPASAAPRDTASVASPDSAGAAGGQVAAPAPKPAVAILSWTDLILLDLGSDAKPEVTQQPEPLPEGTIPPTGIR